MKYKYNAFISYAHPDKNGKDDKRWAEWLQRNLESYNMPLIICKEKDDAKNKKFKIFRDETDGNGLSLRKVLTEALEASDWLIVICSPISARREWVGKEIKLFVDKGRKNRIIPFIVSGVPYSNEQNECLHPDLKKAFPDKDILGVNIDDKGVDPRIFRKRKALVRVVSILVEIPDAYGILWNRYRLRFWEGVALKGLAGVLILVSIIYAGRYNMPFNKRVQLYDRTVENPYLKSPDSLKVSLLLDNERKELVFSSFDESSVFKNIPGRFAGKELRLLVDAYGYRSIDTMVLVKRDGSIIIDLLRDDTFGILSGRIIDEDGQPVAEARIMAEGCETISSEDGSFEIHIPIERQRPCPQVTISKQGYQTEKFTHQPVGRHWEVMLIK